MLVKSLIISSHMHVHIHHGWPVAGIITIRFYSRWCPATGCVLLWHGQSKLVLEQAGSMAISIASWGCCYTTTKQRKTLSLAPDNTAAASKGLSGSVPPKSDLFPALPQGPPKPLLGLRLASTTCQPPGPTAAWCGWSNSLHRPPRLTRQHRHAGASGCLGFCP